MNRGRHSAESTGSFYRDLTMMVVGILLVGAAVFLLLYLFAGIPIRSPERRRSRATTSSSVVATSDPSTSNTTVARCHHCPGQ